MKQKNLILGAGPAGLACAYELSRHNELSFIVEKDEKVGGLAKTLEFKEGNLLFKTDLGPHRFFSKKQELYIFMNKILSKDRITVKRRTRQYIQGRFYDYPLNLSQAYRNIGFFSAISLTLSYFLSFLRFKIFKKKIMNFEDYIIANFGEKLGKFNMLNYTEKILGISCDQLHQNWAIDRISGLNLFTAIKESIFKRTNTRLKTLAGSFYYPRYGAGQIYELIGEALIKKKNILKTESFPESIYHSNNKIKKVELNIKGKTQEAEPENLVTSIPISEFINLLKPIPPISVLNAAKKLKWRSQVYLFITLNKNKISDDNWIYFPTKDIPFARICEIKNFSKEMCPKDKTSVLVEYFVYEKDKIWDMDKDELFEMTFKFLEKTILIKKSEVRKYYLLKRKYVYPIYDLDYDKNLNIIKKYLDCFSNLYYIGRLGRFQYNNQDQSIDMGLKTAKAILNKKDGN